MWPKQDPCQENRGAKLRRVALAKPLAPETGSFETHIDIVNPFSSWTFPDNTAVRQCHPTGNCHLLGFYSGLKMSVVIWPGICPGAKDR